MTREEHDANGAAAFDRMLMAEYFAEYSPASGRVFWRRRPAFWQAMAMASWQLAAEAAS